MEFGHSSVRKYMACKGNRIDNKDEVVFSYLIRGALAYVAWVADDA